MGPTLLRSFVQGSEHARFMLEHDYRSAVVAPLLARGRTLGAISVLRLGVDKPYTEAEQELVCELARRAALAIDNATLYSDLSQVERRLQAVLVNLAEAITVIDGRGRTVFANPAAAELLGVDSAAELVDNELGSSLSRFLMTDEDGRELGLDSMPARRLFKGEEPGPLLVHNVVRATGEERWLNVRSSPVRDPESGRVLYAVNIFENITGVKRAQLAERFMSEASRVLASSMDYHATLQRVAELAVPALADWCWVDVVNEDNVIERIAMHHSDPSRVNLADLLEREYPRSMEEESGAPEVIRSGEARIYTDITPEALAHYARDSEHLRLLMDIRPTAVIIVPMIGATGPVGAITLVASESRRRLTDADVDLARRLARRSGTAVEHARLYAAHSRISSVLQRALQPAALPEIDGFEVRACYVPAGINEVGGDFYDVFRYHEDRWILLIGDVCGKGARAAGVTALARHALRIAAMLGHGPRGMLATLHYALRDLQPDSDFCTVCLVSLTPHEDGARLVVLLAGHQPPLIIEPDGTSAPIGTHGTILGVIEPVDLAEHQAELRPGQTLLLYTDGVPDAGRSSEPLGDAGVAELCSAAPQLSLDGLLEHIKRAASERAGGRLRDDIALLAIRAT
jgi:PAS domain S-box-containing protein